MDNTIGLDHVRELAAMEGEVVVPACAYDDHGISYSPRPPQSYPNYHGFWFAFYSCQIHRHYIPDRHLTVLCCVALLYRLGKYRRPM